MIIRKDTSWLARTLPSLRDVPLTTKAGPGTRPLPPKASPGRPAIFEAPSLSLPSTAFAQRWEWPMKHHPVRQNSESQAYLSGADALCPEKTEHTATAIFNYCWLTAGYDWRRCLMDQVESCWMLTVNGQGAIPPAQHTTPGIQQPRRTSQPISQPRFSGPLLPIQSILFTLLFSCVVTIWLTKHCILRKKLSDGKKAHSKRNFPHLKYRLTDKVFIFKLMQLN